MLPRRFAHYSLVLFTLIILFISLLIIKPFWPYLFFAGLLAFAFNPLNKKIGKHIRNRNLRASIMLAIILILIIAPTIFIVSNLVNQATNAFINFKDENFERFLQKLPFIDSPEERNDLQEFLIDALLQLKHGVADSFLNTLSSLPDFLLGIFIMFFTMFYFFRDGRALYYATVKHLPFEDEVKKKLVDETKLIIQAVIYGQLFTAIIQGLAGTLVLFLFGIPQAAFWGFLMIIAAFIPYIGTFIIWGPATLFLVINEEPTIKIFFFLLINITFVSQIDNIVRPFLIGRKSQLHTSLALIGVLGGLKLFGLVGIVIGPIFLALLVVLTKTLIIEKNGTEWTADKN
ncbi:AI-2E family transporter [Candidatus Woesearchaeota archaeon]|nr:MAG: AI-2E family transporter [Candidatus Woesearchaeota archaeon]